MPNVEDVEDFDPTMEAPPITARRWLRVTGAVAVVADLKSSTKLGLNKNARSTASIYEAALRPVLDIYDKFGAGWIPIQGDCIIGIFWDDLAVERAICAGITAKTFSERHLVERLEKKWPDLPPTGFKVGMATSTVLVKRIGRPASAHQTLVWPGKALNYAVKAAQSGDTELIVTGSMWDFIADNDYLTFTCDCARPSPLLWHDHDLQKLDHDDAERAGRCLTSAWCPTCGRISALGSLRARSVVAPLTPTGRSSRCPSSRMPSPRSLRPSALPVATFAAFGRAVDQGGIREDTPRRDARGDTPGGHEGEHPARGRGHCRSGRGGWITGSDWTLARERGVVQLLAVAAFAFALVGVFMLGAAVFPPVGKPSTGQYRTGSVLHGPRPVHNDLGAARSDGARV